VQINIIAAVSSNGVIGLDGGLPWCIPADLKRFKSVTMGYPLIMGRRTHESIGRTLPGRLNIVVSRQQKCFHSGSEIAGSLDAALVIAGDAKEVMVIGGATLYTAALGIARRIYLTEVHADIKGDTVFPQVDWTEWTEVSRNRHVADLENEYDYSFVMFDRARAD
tara:strand:- start:1412 stop:1906 length:495 start_codon:yes stop_codon:yes gene_type:complete